MPLLANILQGDRTDLDLIQLALETLANVVTYETGSDEGIVSLCNGYFFYAFVYLVEQANLPHDITVQFTGIDFVLLDSKHIQFCLFRIV
jgi:hypothetical protein